MKSKDTKKSVVDVYVIPINTLKESLKIVNELRKENLKADMALDKKGISKGLGFANSLNIPFVLFIGEDELKVKKVKLKDMGSGKEELLLIKDVVKKIREKENEK